MSEDDLQLKGEEEQRDEDVEETTETVAEETNTADVQAAGSNNDGQGDASAPAAQRAAGGGWKKKKKKNKHNNNNNNQQQQQKNTPPPTDTAETSDDAPPTEGSTSTEAVEECPPKESTPPADETSPTETADETSTEVEVPPADETLPVSEDSGLVQDSEVAAESPPPPPAKDDPHLRLFGIDDIFRFTDEKLEDIPPPLDADFGEPTEDSLDVQEVEVEVFHLDELEQPELVVDTSKRQHNVPALIPPDLEPEQMQAEEHATVLSNAASVQIVYSSMDDFDSAEPCSSGEGGGDGTSADGDGGQDDEGIAAMQEEEMRQEQLGSSTAVLLSSWMAPEALTKQAAVRALTKTLQTLGDEAASTVFQVVEEVCAEERVGDMLFRIEVLEQLPLLYMHTVTQPSMAHYRRSVLLPIMLRSIEDVSHQVRKVAQAGLFLLIEQNILVQDDLEQFIVPAILKCTSRDKTNEDIRIETTGVLCHLFRPLGRDLAVRMLLQRFIELCQDNVFHIRKVCATELGMLSKVLGTEYTEKYVVPYLMLLCQDNIWGVRKAASECFNDVSLHCSMRTRRRNLAPTFIVLLADNSRWVQSAAFQSLGPFISTFADSNRTGLKWGPDGELLYEDPSEHSASEGNNSEDETDEARDEFTVDIDLHLPPATSYTIPTRARTESDDDFMEMDALVSPIGSPVKVSHMDRAFGDLSRLGVEDDGAGEEEEEEKQEEVQHAKVEEGSSGEAESGLSEPAMPEPDAPTNADGRFDDAEFPLELEEPAAPLLKTDVTHSDDDPPTTSSSTSSAITVIESQVEKLALNEEQAGGATEHHEDNQSTSVEQQPQEEGADEQNQNKDVLELQRDEQGQPVGAVFHKHSPGDRLNTSDEDAGSEDQVKDYSAVDEEVNLKPSAAQVDLHSAIMGEEGEGKGAEEGFIDDEMWQKNSYEPDHYSKERAREKAEVADHFKMILERNQDEETIGQRRREERQKASEDQDIIPRELLENFLSMTDPARAQVENDIQRHCAFNLPAVAYTIGRQNWRCLKPTYLTLANDMQWKIRRTLAFSIHELAAILGPELTTSDLLPVFLSFLKDLDEVRIGILKHLFDFIKVLEPDHRRDLLQGIASFLNPDNARNWRFKLLLAEQMIPLCQLYDIVDINEYFSPIAFTLATERVMDVRRVASRLLATMLNHFVADGGDREAPNEIAAKFVSDLLKSFADSVQFWRRRQLFVMVLTDILRLKSVRLIEVMCDSLLTVALRLSKDKVVNMRISVAQLLADLYANDQVEFCLGKAGANTDLLESIMVTLSYLGSEDERDAEVRQIAQRALQPYVAFKQPKETWCDDGNEPNAVIE